MHDYRFYVDGDNAPLRGSRGRGRGGLADVAGQPDQLPAARLRHPAGQHGQHPRVGPQEQAGGHAAAPAAARRRARPGCSAARSRTTWAAARRCSPIAWPPTPERPTRWPRARSAGAPTPTWRPRAPPSATRRSGPVPTVKIEGVGTQLGGTYIVSSSTHTYKGKSGYQTSFQISGRSERGLLDLVHPPERHDWSRDLVVGVVTNNNDPDADGARAGQVPLAQRQRGERLGAGRVGLRRQRPRPDDAPAARRGGDRRLRARRHPPPDRARLALQRQGQARGGSHAEPRRQLRAALQREGPHPHQEGLRDQERPGAEDRDHQGRDDQGAGEDRAGGLARHEAQGRHDLRDRGGQHDDAQGRVA